ncbi:MAG: hypothetical protein KBT20_09080 [Bacteroidales bacterium]|nr:hypothetical protein [Candidatus Liminaster caballi]
MKKVLFAVLSASLLFGCQSNTQQQQSSEPDAAQQAAQTVSATQAAPAAKQQSELKDVYVYEFVVTDSRYRLTLDVKEETAQLYITDVNTGGNPVRFYGSCKRDRKKPWIVESGGFEGTEGYNIIMNGEHTWWDISQYIDTRENFIYLTYTSYKAKNPDYRLALTPIEMED